MTNNNPTNRNARTTSHSGLRSLPRRRFMASVVAGGSFAVAGCVGDIQASVANKTAADAADEIQNRFEAQLWLDRMEIEVRDNDDIETTLWVFDLPDEETLLTIYADVIAGGYQCNDLIGTIRFDVFAVYFIIKREWAEQFNAGEISYATYEDNVLSNTGHWIAS